MTNDTNSHPPLSILIMLVCAFASRNLIMKSRRGNAGLTDFSASFIIIFAKTINKKKEEFTMMEPDEFREKCKGIVPVQYCPYTKDCASIDLKALERNTQFLVDFAKNGTKDVIILTNGSTTEFYANSMEEQRSVIKTVVETVDGSIPVIVGVSQAGTKEAIKMAKYAEEVGADCAMVTLPYYHTPFKEGLYQHYKAIADSINIAIMIYNNPDVSGAIIDPELMARLSKIDNIVALKDNTPITGEFFFKTLLIEPDDMALLNGMGEIAYLGSAAYGFRYKGFITFIGNFAPQLSYELYESVERERDFVKAEEVLKKLAPIWGLVTKFSAKRPTPSLIPGGYKTPYAYMDLGKAAMDLIPGLYGGPIRLPLQDTTDDEKGELKEALKKVGLL
jgi:4-hydroxy-tetrahydrodipicolinate synthase